MSFRIRMSMAMQVYLHSWAREDSVVDDEGTDGVVGESEDEGAEETIEGDERAKRPSHRAMASCIGNSLVNSNLSHRLVLCSDSVISISAFSKTSKKKKKKSYQLTCPRSAARRHFYSTRSKAPDHISSDTHLHPEPDGTSSQSAQRTVSGSQSVPTLHAMEQARVEVVVRAIRTRSLQKP